MVGENLLSWFDVDSVPENYVFPPERRPGKLDAPSPKGIPVVDLQGHERFHVVQQIMEASEKFGIFQVINHGVSKQYLLDAMRVSEEFFNMSTEEKAKVNERGLVYASSTDYAKDGVNLWRENLKYVCHPFDRMLLCPENPIGFRKAVTAYLTEIRKLSTTILDLISEGLGLENGFFADMSELQLLVTNHYPPCPDPSLTLGILSHCDPSIISLLLQDVVGLQVLINGEYVSVEPLPHAFVVIIGSQLQGKIQITHFCNRSHMDSSSNTTSAKVEMIISNQKLRSAEHRAVTNSSKARTSITSFINPTFGSIIEPAKVLTNTSNHSQANAYLYKDYVDHLKAFGPHTDQILRSI